MRTIKPIRSTFPRQIERDYAKALIIMFDKWIDEFVKDIEQQLPKIIESKQDSVNDACSTERIKNDAYDYGSLIKLVINKHKGIFDTAYLAFAKKKIVDTFHSTDRWTKQQQEKVVKAVAKKQRVLGVNVANTELWRLGLANAYIEQNVSLVKKVSEDVTHKIESSLFEGIRQGLPSKSIAKQIKETTDLSTYRSNLIARDQTAKLTAQMVEKRQLAAGVEEYEISTADDERTCDECSALDGKRFRWDDPDRQSVPVHVSCRCSCNAVLDKFFE